MARPGSELLTDSEVASMRAAAGSATDPSTRAEIRLGRHYRAKGDAMDLHSSRANLLAAVRHSKSATTKAEALLEYAATSRAMGDGSMALSAEHQAISSLVIVAMRGDHTGDQAAYDIGRICRALRKDRLEARRWLSSASQSSNLEIALRASRDLADLYRSDLPHPPSARQAEARLQEVVSQLPVARANQLLDEPVQDFLDQLVASAPRYYGRERCWVSKFVVDKTLPGQDGTQATYSWITGEVGVSPSFMTDVRKFVSGSYRTQSAEAQTAFLRRLSKQLEAAHHELTHAQVDPQRIAAETKNFGGETEEVRAVREAFTEAAARRSYTSFLADTGFTRTEPRLANCPRDFNGYPAHVIALEAIVDHLVERGESAEQLFYDFMELGTSRAALEHLCNKLLAVDDVHARANFWRDTMKSFSQLTTELDEHNQGPSKPYDASRSGRKVARALIDQAADERTRIAQREANAPVMG